MSPEPIRRRRCRARWRAGFTLIEVIIAVAIIAVLAGAITPMVFKELMSAREDATERELATLATALTDFYADTGRLPSEAEGLAALVVDPGVSGWQGPYVATERGDPVAETATDAFNEPYVYDLQPATNPPGVADVVVASPGIDGALEAGSLGSTWTLAGVGDDLIQPVNIGPVDRAKVAEAETEVLALADAIRAYYADRTAFPVSVNDLVPDYLDPGVAGDALLDPWQQGYLVSATPLGGVGLELSVRSRGPDRADDGGADDDIAATVSNVPLGRQISTWKQEIAQDAVNATGLVLSGVWPADRAALGLPATFDLDGWGQPFQIRLSPDIVYSAGPDAVAAQTLDNVPAGVGP
jgi:general secretion pathway protein G